MAILLVGFRLPHPQGRVVVCSAADVMHSSCQPARMYVDLACLQALTGVGRRYSARFAWVGYRSEIEHATSVWGEKGWDEIRHIGGDRAVVSSAASALHRVGVAQAGWFYHAPRVALESVSLLTLWMSELARVGFWVLGSPWARTEVVAIGPTSSGWVGSKLPGEKRPQAAALQRWALPKPVGFTMPLVSLWSAYACLRFG